MNDITYGIFSVDITHSGCIFYNKSKIQSTNLSSVIIIIMNIEEYKLNSRQEEGALD